MYMYFNCQCQNVSLIRSTHGIVHAVQQRCDCPDVCTWFLYCRSGMTTVLSATLASSTSTSGVLVSGWMWLWMTICPLTMESWSTWSHSQRTSSGVLCSKRLMQSKYHNIIAGNLGTVFNAIWKKISILKTHQFNINACVPMALGVQITKLA